MRSLNGLTKTLGKLVDWRDSLEIRLAAANKILNKGLPDPYFGYLEAEVTAFTTACARITNRLGERHEKRQREEA